MFRFACVILFLSLGHDIMCDMSGAVGNPTIVLPSTQATTLPPTTTKATTLPPTTTKATTLPPTTNATTLPPTTNATTLAPTTNATTPAPVPTTNATTPAPVPTTNATTPVPTTNATTPAPVPTTTPTPTLPTPSTGKYSIKTGNSTCLLADFGLRIGFIQGGKGQEINLMPNATTSTGTCGVNTSELILTSDVITIIFSFNHEVKNFRLHALNVTIKSDSGVDFKQANTNLTLWQAAVGSSYMCNKQQSYNITDVLTLDTYELRVQPFEVTKDKFSTAEDCQADGESFLVPIAVGVALAVLILIVLLAYFIGRKRNQGSGYESF
ncbi:lysosome-associated membrane glycoprotein 2 isoform X2 [Osmerus mordax]|uniref:lysosome-associated membrane glycoprotein 2 isoform X2 n=1 Tax=Osmerus mordax TaxID=8014 RepID=UPI00350F9876